MRYFKHLGLMLGVVDQLGLKTLRNDARVQDVSGAPQLRWIRPVSSRSTTTVAAAKTTWGIRRLGVDKLWSKGLTGKGVLVGHLDTGVDGRHPALKGAVAHFAEFDYLGMITGKKTPYDSDEHGTHTAGTIVGRAVRGVSFGIAPEAKLASGLVIEGGNAIARVLAGMDWIVEKGARILSMSLGFPGYVDDFETVIQALRENGVLPVIAVGNEGPGTSRSPGNYDSVIGVGAFDRADGVADFSSSQVFRRKQDPTVPDLVAPGVDVLSCVPGGQYKEMDGTSMATPHIAGLAALLLQAKPSATVDELERAVIASCVRPATMPVDRANRGVPDATAALQALVGVAVGTKRAGKPQGRRKRRA
jgi:subtilisin family serine protease